jgi:hypothetical protein
VPPGRPGCARSLTHRPLATDIAAIRKQETLVRHAQALSQNSANPLLTRLRSIRDDNSTVLIAARLAA